MASFQAAAALLFSQLLHNGVAVEVQPEQILLAALSEFTDIAQVIKRVPCVHFQCFYTGTFFFPALSFLLKVCVRVPFEYGVLDGIVFLLYQLLAQVSRGLG